MEEKKTNEIRNSNTFTNILNILGLSCATMNSLSRPILVTMITYFFSID